MRHTHYALPFVVSLLASASIASAQRCDHPLFTQVELPVPNQGTATAVADLNGDGLDDIVVVGDTMQNLIIYLSEGDGGFRIKYDIPFDTWLAARHVDVGDVDGDGDIDLVIREMYGILVSTYLNNGRADFKRLGGTTDFANDLAFVDIDDNSRADLVMTHSNDIRLRYDDGSLLSYSLSNALLGAVAVADFDNDGFLDIAAHDSNGRIALLLNDGFNSFEWTLVPDVPAVARDLIAADFNGDGAVDLLLYQQIPGSISVFFNNGLGQFFKTYSLGLELRCDDLTSVDIDGDTDIDLVVALPYNGIDGSVAVLRNDGDGAFSAPEFIGSPDDAHDVNVIDANNDGHPDVIAPATFSISVLINNGNGRFEQEPPEPAVGIHPNDVVVADIDLDGSQDIIFAARETSQLVILRQRTSSSPAQVAIMAVPAIPRLVRAAQLTNDNAMDLVVFHTEPFGANPGFSTYRNSGNGKFTLVSTVFGSFSAWFETGDLNGDTLEDVVTPIAYGGRIYLSDGTGGFSSDYTYTHGSSSYRMKLGDIDNDGDLDTVHYNELSSEEIVIAVNDGSGSLRRGAALPTHDNSIGMGLGDIDADGDLDVVYVGYNNRQITALVNDGFGSFTAHDIACSGLESRNLHLVDLNGDGLLDIVVNREVVEVHFNRGDRVFGIPLAYGAPGEFILRARGDMNNDGDIDLVGFNYLVDGPIILDNLCAP